MGALDPRKPPIRYADRVRWQPMQYIAETDRAVPYQSLSSGLKDIARHVTSIIYVAANRKDPL